MPAWSVPQRLLAPRSSRAEPDVEFEPSDPDLVPLGSEQPAGDNTTIVTAASADQPADVGWATAMPAGHVVDAALESLEEHRNENWR